VNISKPQQRTLHALAQGGAITLVRDDKGGVIAARCHNRDGWLLSDCDLAVFKALKSAASSPARAAALTASPTAHTRG